MQTDELLFSLNFHSGKKKILSPLGPKRKQTRSSKSRNKGEKVNDRTNVPEYEREN